MGWSETVHAIDCECGNCQAKPKMMKKPLNEWRDEALRVASDHGFTDASIPEDVALMHSELSELLEDFRKGNLPTSIWTIENKDKSFKPCGIPIELADLLLRAFHFAGKHKIDLDRAVEMKHEYNKSRSFKHGGKVI